MYERILAGLKDKFPGLPERYLERKAKSLAKTTTTEEQVKTAVEGVTFQQIIDSECDKRVNEAQENIVANYEKKYNLKNGKPLPQSNGESTTDPLPQPNGGNGGKSDEDIPAWAKALMEQNKTLTSELNAIKGERTAKSRRSQYEALFEKLNDDAQKERYMRDWDRLKFKDDEDFNKWFEERKPIIESEVNTFIQHGATTNPPRGGAPTPPTGEASQEVKDFVEATAAHEAERSFSTIAGLPTSGGGKL